MGPTKDHRVSNFSFHHIFGWKGKTSRTNITVLFTKSVNHINNGSLLIKIKLDDFKWCTGSQIDIFGQLPVALISFDPSGPNISTGLQQTLLLTPERPNKSENWELKKKCVLFLLINISGVIILVESQTAGFGGLLLWWNELTIFRHFFLPQYLTHVWGRGLFSSSIFWHLYRYRGTVIILSPSLSWQVYFTIIKSLPGPVAFSSKLPFSIILTQGSCGKRLGR